MNLKEIRIISITHYKRKNNWKEIEILSGPNPRYDNCEFQKYL